MCFEKGKYFRQVLLGLIFCLNCQNVFSHQQDLESHYNAYGSCQKPIRSEQDLSFNPCLGTGTAVHPVPVSQAPELFIFVSKSQPEQSLKQWAAQTEKAGGTLVLRGFIEDSPKKTLEWVMGVFGERTKGVTIDPERFTEFSINKVPAVVIFLPSSDTSQTSQNQKPPFEVVYGDVPLEEALLALRNRGSKEIREASNRFLARLRDRLP